MDNEKLNKKQSIKMNGSPLFETRVAEGASTDILSVKDDEMNPNIRSQLIGDCWKDSIEK